MAENYTAEQTKTLLTSYQSGMTVEELASQLDKPVRSIRSKLVREGVYVAQPRNKTAKIEGPSKKSPKLTAKSIENIAPGNAI